MLVSNDFVRRASQAVALLAIVNLAASHASSRELPITSLFRRAKTAQPAAIGNPQTGPKGLALPYPSLLLNQRDGNQDSMYVGYAMDGGRDVNGDGTPDYVIGAPISSLGGTVNAGTVFVHSGIDGSLIRQIDGSDSGDVFGVAVCLLGDINGDGRSEIVIGAPYADPGGLVDAGSVYMYSGINGSLLQQKDGAAAGDNFGWSVGRAGTVNPDASPDYIVGAPYADSGSLENAGIAYVYSGVGGGLLYRKFGALEFDNFGWSVDGVGNVNGDARSDFIVGAPYADTSLGAAYVYSGLTGGLLYHVTGDSITSSFGGAVAGAGDVNADGRADFIIGAPSQGPDLQSSPGAAYVYSGFDANLLRRFDGQADDLLGNFVDGAGDVNDDGKDDVIVGAPGTDPTGVNPLTGAAHVFSVLNGAQLHYSLGQDEMSTYGFSVTGIGDLNGDGRSEFGIGAPLRAIGSNSAAGSAYVRAWGAVESIEKLSDVGNDQGKQIRIQWSNLPGNDGFIREFAIYRRVDGDLSSKAHDPYGLKATPPGTWDFVTSVPARGDSTYSAIVPTLRDSTVVEGMWWTAYFVSGIGENTVDHFDSPVDSGYSLDNLAPSPPLNLIALQAGPTVDLDWKPTSATDFDFYWVYRDTVPGFSPAPGKRIGTTSDTDFVDNAAPVANAIYYRVSAVDFSGNEGLASAEASTSACACECAHDPLCDGKVDVFDLTHAINVAFRNTPAITDPNASCPYTTTDVDCSGLTDIFDVARIVNVAFRNANASTEFCDPCE